jgi:hypothetical protein
MHGSELLSSRLSRDRQYFTGPVVRAKTRTRSLSSVLIVLLVESANTIAMPPTC